MNTRELPTSSLERMIRFVKWADAMRDAPTWRSIAEHFHLSKATAYRWRKAWCAANGMSSDNRPQRNFQ